MNGRRPPSGILLSTAPGPACHGCCCRPTCPLFPVKHLLLERRPPLTTRHATMELRLTMRGLTLAALLFSQASAHEHHGDKIAEGHAISEDPIVRLHGA